MVLVRQAGKAVAEFVYHNRGICGMMGGSKFVRVVYASTAIGGGIGQDYDMLVRQAGNEVVQACKLQRCQVPVGVKSMGTLTPLSWDGLIAALTLNLLLSEAKGS